MGPLVTWDNDGERGFVTNSHCTNNQGGVESTDTYQPTLGSDLIGQEIRDPEYSSSLYSCPSGRDCRYSDSALIEFNADISTTKGLLYGTTSRDPEQGSTWVEYEYYTDIVQERFIEGFFQDKIGRTTGWTYGELVRACENIPVFREVNGFPVDTGITLLCQNEVQANSGRGDSGSPVFEREGGDSVRLVGLMWGGGIDQNGNDVFLYSPIDQVEEDLTDIYDPDDIQLDFGADRCAPSAGGCS